MDDADRADLAIQQHLEAALANAAAMARTVLGHPATSTTCQECGQEIEHVRIKHSFSICAACAKDREHFAAHGRTYR